MAWADHIGESHQIIVDAGPQSCEAAVLEVVPTTADVESEDPELRQPAIRD